MTSHSEQRTEKEKLRQSPRQRNLLAALSRTEWRRAPPGTLGPTLVALWNRGVIEGRFASGYMTAGRYADAYEWRLT